MPRCVFPRLPSSSPAFALARAAAGEPSRALSMNGEHEATIVTERKTAKYQFVNCLVLVALGLPRLGLVALDLRPLVRLVVGRPEALTRSGTKTVSLPMRRGAPVLAGGASSMM